MSEDEAIQKCKNIISHKNDKDFAYGKTFIHHYMMSIEEIEAIETILDLHKKESKQNQDVKDYIEYFLLNNMTIEGNKDNTHKELQKLYKMLGGNDII